MAHPYRERALQVATQCYGQTFSPEALLDAARKIEAFLEEEPAPDVSNTTSAEAPVTTGATS